MQEFHQSIPGLAGRLFGASDLRRAHHHHHQQGPPGAAARCGGVPPAEAVKCPRCESTNTKFCYYNNYNLSQPRHFCKSCRRYWTKGGVLRNVPVGGGCRKAKRSSSSASSSSAATAASSTSAGEASKNPRRTSASSPSSTNSGSTSPTAATTTTTTATSTNNNNNNIVINNGGAATIPFSTVDVAPPAPIFADQAAALASLFAPPPPLPVFSFTAQQPKDELLAAAARPVDEPTTSADMAPFTSLDAGIFEQLGVDASAAAYWNAGTCWTDPTVYLP
ncbi:hypothetical protein PR202_ga02580 [Eleusine coracana subsp. coracana]|uniref:Dof zinc finger protein n=1 Tax=Eleusine coracana subsp. coracana TaxID=191504 RepID=A0AAV5BL55_ELECO|nr:hypothetical protein PR202_ga02580 [Eleusine coracana subsp. coracana]